MKKGVCTNYDGREALFGDLICGAGINMRDITGGEKLGWIKRMPCIAKNISCVKCDSYQEPTDKEVSDYDSWIEVAIDRMRRTQPTIQQLKKDNPDGGHGVIDCPCCDGELHWSIAECNGHCHGRCTTEGCLNWME